MAINNAITLEAVTPDNVEQETLFCIKTVNNEDFESKRTWFQKRYEKGLRLHILKETDGRMIGFIEFTPAKLAWRPIKAPNFMFIHCMYVQSKKDRNLGYGGMLIAQVEEIARNQGMHGLCVMTSKGSWIANKSFFLKNGFEQVDQRGRFELLSKKWAGNPVNPKLLNWEEQQKGFKGWHLLYAEQCPWHHKSVTALKQVARENGILLHVKKLETAMEAQLAPSGYGVFSLLHNDKLLEDHYLSATRFKSILKKEQGRSRAKSE